MLFLGKQYHVYILFIRHEFNQKLICIQNKTKQNIQPENIKIFRCL